MAGVLQLISFVQRDIINCLPIRIMRLLNLPMLSVLRMAGELQLISLMQ
jgi:hypothetical protein